MIGIFDSGIGGLTVAKEVMKQLPGFSILYLGDTARTPYGNKSPEAVRRYALEDARWLIDHGAKVLIIACNTMSALATETLRAQFQLPIFDVIRPAVIETGRISPRKRIGVIGTRATIASRAYETQIRSISPNAEIFTAACPLFVPLVEEGWFKRAETKRVAAAYLGPLKLKQLDALILGCTHYPLLKEVIKHQMGRRVKLVDSAEATVQHVKAYFDAQPELADHLAKGNRHEWYLTDLAPQYDEIATSWLGQAVKFRQADLVSLPAKQSK